MINIKIKKLIDNIDMILSSEQCNETYYILTTKKYLNDALASEFSDYENMKKTLINIKALILKFKGTFSTQLLLDRSKCK